MRYKLDDDDKTLAHNSADMPKDPKKALKKVSSNLKKASATHAKQSKVLAKASKTHAKDAETVSKLTKDMKRTKNPGYSMKGKKKGGSDY
tara:strand:+ start:731 stop:1000 length:270 start_codon:yes stop_codon:yes gene_type:complete